MKSILAQMFDETVRVEQIIHLGTMCMDYAFPSEVQDAFEEDCESVWEALGRKTAPDDFDAEEVGDWLRRKKKEGFLVKFATPVPSNFTESGYSTNGWGYYSTHWVYSESFDDACLKGLEWAKAYIEKERARCAA